MRNGLVMPPPPRKLVVNPPSPVGLYRKLLMESAKNSPKPYPNGTLTGGVFYKMTLPAVIVSLEGKPLHVNGAAERFLGYSEQALRDLHFAEITVGRYIDADIQLFKEVIAGIRSWYAITKAWKTPYDSEVSGMLIVQEIKSLNGQYILAVILPQSLTLEQEQDSQDLLLGKDAPWYLRLVGSVRKMSWKHWFMLATLLIFFYLTVLGGMDKILDLLGQ